jgi:hypothetical protein
MDSPPKRRGRIPKAEGGEYKEAVLTERFQTMLDPVTHAWVLANGGGKYIRRLIEEDRERQVIEKGNEGLKEHGGS